MTFLPNIIAPQNIYAMQMGSCTKTITWQYDKSSRTLAIDGMGAMPGYENTTDIPWHDDIADIENIIISDGITEIGKGAFYECINLRQAELPPSLNSIHEYASNGCKQLEKIVFPAKLKKIEDSAFYGCQKLKQIQIPASVEEIGIGVFASCSGLDKAECLAAIYSLPNYTFDQCSSLRDIELPETLTQIGTAVFDGCKALTAISIPQNVKSLGKSLFGQCINLKCVTLPEGLTAMSDGVFAGCKSLEHIEIPSTVNQIPSLCFYGCSALKEIEIPDCVNTIGNYAFANCNSLQKIWMPKSIVSIGKQIFMDSNSVIIHGYQNSVIGDYAINENLELLAYDVKENYILNIQNGSTYTSQGQEPEVTVMFQGEILRKDQDYDVFYSNNIQAGTATVTVQGKNHFDVELNSNFVISPVSIKTAQIVFSQDIYIYDNTAQKPTLNITLNSNRLIEQKDYILQYGDCINSGAVPVTITGIGNYQGSIIKYYTIEKSRQYVTAHSVKKAIGSAPFFLNAKISGNGTVTYHSNKPSVAEISSSGMITLKKIGQATISIHISETRNSKKAAKTIKITVVPKRTTLLNAKSNWKKTITAKWKKNLGVTGYQICCSTALHFNQKVKYATVSGQKQKKP